MHIPHKTFNRDRALVSHAIGALHAALEIAEITADWLAQAKIEISRFQAHLSRCPNNSHTDESLMVPQEYCLPLPESANWCHASSGKTYNADIKWHPSEALAVHLAPWQESVRQSWSESEQIQGVVEHCVCLRSHSNFTRGFWLCRSCGADTKRNLADPSCSSEPSYTICRPCAQLQTA